MDSFTLNIDFLPVGVAIYQKDGDDFTFIAFNKQAELIDSTSADALLNKKLTEVFPGVKEFGLFDILVRVEKTGKNEIFETKFYKDNRISGWRRNEIVKLSDGVVAAFYSDRNIEKELKEKGLTLEKKLNKIEMQLEHEKHVFQQIMENSEAISVQGYNAKREVIYWNKASEILYGYSKEEAFGKKLEDLIIPDFMQNAVKELVNNWVEKMSLYHHLKLHF